MLVAFLGPWNAHYNRYDSADQSVLIGQSYWWSMASPSVVIQAKLIAPTIRVIAVYAYPQLVEGGQRYDINLFI